LLVSYKDSLDNRNFKLNERSSKRPVFKEARILTLPNIHTRNDCQNSQKRRSEAIKSGNVSFSEYRNSFHTPIQTRKFHKDEFSLINNETLENISLPQIEQARLFRNIIDGNNAHNNDNAKIYKANQNN
jgi:hypothetical protein